MTLTVMVLLTVIILLALFLPFTLRLAEEQLEAFLFVLGILAVSITGAWTWHLVGEAFKEPVAISLAVLITGLLFRKFKKQLDSLVILLEEKLGLRPAVFLIILVLSLLSSIITAIIAALALCEITSNLKLSRRDSIHIIVMGCFAIGLGAVLTPIGEPFSTIVTAKLSKAPHYAGFFYLLNLLWKFVLPGIVFFAFAATRLEGKHRQTAPAISEEKVKDIVLRAAKVFVFVMALILFGKGLTPLAESTIIKLPVWALFWANSISAVLDNATLAAAEIVPAMTNKQIEFMLIALIISGGFLIPGNIPNIICASKFKIKSKEWAKKALPLGICVMLIYFIVLSILPVAE